MHPATPNAALAELLARIGATGGGLVELADDELQHWPSAAMSTFKERRLLVPATPGETTTCPGCERACVMPVQWGLRGGSRRAPFIICDKREDIHRVALDEGALICWRADLATVADVLSVLLAVDGAAVAASDAASWRIGFAAGSHGRSAVQLLCSDGRLVVNVAGHVIELMLLLTVRDGRLVLDVRRLAQCADQPMATGTVGETRQQRAERLRARRAELQRQGVRAFLQRMAHEEGVSVSMVKKVLSRADQPARPASVNGALAAMAKGVSTARRRNR